MCCSYDLLIIYSDKTRKVVCGVTNYGVTKDSTLFYFDKNGYRSFVTISQVRFFGRMFDYDNCDKEELPYE